MLNSIIPLCSCGCKTPVTQNQNYLFLWNKYIHGHNRRNKKASVITKKKMSKFQQGKIISGKTKQKMSIAAINRKRTKLSEETKLKIAISEMRCRIDGYCDAWSDLEYKKDCRKNYCEICEIKEKIINITFRRKFKIINMLKSNLLLHHKDCNPKNCNPDNLQTLCCSCHGKRHVLLREKGKFYNAKYK
jgi:hypothetical protein